MGLDNLVPMMRDALFEVANASTYEATHRSLGPKNAGILKGRLHVRSSENWR